MNTRVQWKKESLTNHYGFSFGKDFDFGWVLFLEFYKYTVWICFNKGSQPVEKDEK